MKIQQLLRRVLHPWGGGPRSPGAGRGTDGVELGSVRADSGIYGPGIARAASTSPAPGPEADAAFSSAGLAHQLASLGGSCDASRIPFRIMLELRGDVNRAGRHLTGTGWTAERTPVDCSHWPDWAPGESEDLYVRVQSPRMTLADGAAERITEALTRLSKSGATLGPTGGMRFYVPQSTLTDQGTESLVLMHRSSSDILYRLGCSGGAGRAINHKEYFAQNLGEVLPREQPHESWVKTLASSSLGLNSSQRGEWELRYFDPSLSGRALSADVGLLLGMVKAANDGRGDWHGRTADGGSLLEAYARPVSRTRLDAVLDAWVGKGPLREQLLAQFSAAGGKTV